jgi:hypothetical protein
VFAIAVSQPAKAAAMFGTVALTGVSDKCNLNPLGGTTQGDATTIAPQGLLVESCNSLTINVNASANASAGIAQGNVVLSDGAYVLGSLHAPANVIGPAGAHGRAIASEVLNIVPTGGFTDGYFKVKPASFTFNSDVNNGVLSSPSTVREPATLALLGIGLAGLGHSRRRNLH